MKNRSLTLMQHHDGELDPEQAAELEASLTDEDAAVLDGLSQLGDVIREHGDARASGADSIADDVLAKLDSDEEVDGEKQVAALLRVIEGGANGASPAPERQRQPEPQPEPTPEREFRSLRQPPAAYDPKEGRAGRVFLGLSLAAAVALGIHAIATTDYSKPEQSVASLSETVPTPATSEAEIAEPETDLSAAAIESIDFGSQNGAIFMVSAGAETTPVVWLTDDPQSGDRMEPL